MQEVKSGQFLDPLLGIKVVHLVLGLDVTQPGRRSSSKTGSSFDNVEFPLKQLGTSHMNR